MALPAPGTQIKFSEVNTELGVPSTTQRTLSSAGVDLASITAGQQVRLSADLGGKSAGDTITLLYSSFPGTSYLGQGYYRTANHNGHTSPQIITIDFNYSCNCSGQGFIKYSINSTGSWVTVRSWFGGSVSGSYSITNVAYNDIVRVLWYATSGTMQGNVSQFNGGTVTSGSGTVTGNSTWVVT